MNEKYLAPEFRLEVNGAPLAVDVSKNVTGVSVTLVPDAIDSLRLTLANPSLVEHPWPHGADADLFREGSALRVWMGYAGASLTRTFDGEVTGITPTFPEAGSPTVEVEAFSRLHRLQRNFELITLRDATDGDMARRIAAASGLDARVDDPGIIHPQLSTGRAPHLRYLLARARAVGREVWVEGTTLHFAARRDTGEPVHTLVWGDNRDGFAGDSLPLQSFTPSMDVRRQVGAVVVRGQDPLTREVIEGRAGGAGGTAPGGRRIGARVRAAAPGGAPEMVIVDEPVTSPAEAQARARAIHDERALELVQGSGATLGHPGLRPGTVVTLDGVGPRFSGDYYVVRVTHSIGGGGYRTTFDVGGRASLLDALQPAPGAAVSRVYGVVTGVVTNNRDPETLGRVKVRFPWLSDEEESPWARVAAPMAGSGRGLWLLPEVDDEVLVAFEHGDPRFPVVVGALWSQKAPPPETNEDGGNNVRVLRSRGGHVVRLDDTEGRETIEIADGSGKSSIRISTADNAITITCDGDLTLESRAGKVVLKGAGGVEVTSGDAMKLKADADVSLATSGGNVAVKSAAGKYIDLN